MKKVFKAISALLSAALMMVGFGSKTVANAPDAFSVKQEVLAKDFQEKFSSVPENSLLTLNQNSVSIEPSSTWDQCKWGDWRESWKDCPRN